VQFNKKTKLILESPRNPSRNYYLCTMGQKKLIKFAAIKEYENVLEYPQDMPGKWDSFFSALDKTEINIELNELVIAQPSKPLVLELACGRGEYAVGLGRILPNQNFVGLDLKGNRIWKGASIANRDGLKNVAFIRTQIDQVTQYFAKDEVAEIWITFPDPQLRLSKAKKRLTHPKFLRLYQQFLKQEDASNKENNSNHTGIVHLKTDSPNLYLFTKTVIELYGLTMITATDNLYSAEFMQSDKWDDRFAIKTYYEGLNIASSGRIHYIQFKLDKELPIELDEKLKEVIAEFEVTETHDSLARNGKQAME